MLLCFGVLNQFRKIGVLNQRKKEKRKIYSHESEILKEKKR
jgi:hypothetical protein